MASAGISSGAIRATTSVPFIYRLILTTLEPIFATGGAMISFFQPSNYLSTMTRHQVAYAPNTRFLYTELGGAWLYFAFVEAIVFRMFDNLRLWRVLCTGMLLSDFAYCHSAAQAVGGWGPWCTLSNWTVEDWTVLVTTAPMVLSRILIVLGVGITAPRAAKKQN